MRIVHAADLHLDSPLSGLESYEGAPLDLVRSATRRALVNLVELCVSEGAQLLLIAGDLYDGDWRDYATGLFFLDQMSRLSDSGIDVVWIRGNHDAASKITRHLKPPPRVRELSVTEAETVVFEHDGLAVHGMGYATAETRENLVKVYPRARSGLLNFGLLHTALDGRSGHQGYCPCAAAELSALGYDYWALGHVHQREVVAEGPWIVFPGNLQGRHIREPGAKGATLIETDGRRVASVTHRPLDVVRWATTRVPMAGLRSFDEAIEAAVAALRVEFGRADGRLLATRVEFSGATEAHARLVDGTERLKNQLRLELRAVGDVYLEDVRVETWPALDLTELRARQDALGQLFLRAATYLSGEPDELGRFREALREGMEKVPRELMVEQLADAEGLLSEAERLLMARLLGADEPDGGP